MRGRSGFGWLELLTGILLFILGIIGFIYPDMLLEEIVFACGVAAIIMGIADILLYLRVERFTGFGPMLSLISGIMSVMTGIMLIAYPGIGAMAVTILFPIWFIAHCISRLMNLNHVRYIAGNGMYYVLLIINIIGLILGCMMLLSPLFSLRTLRLFSSLYLILLGADAICMAVSNMGRRF